MKKRTLNKLVRDRIPNILIKTGLAFKAKECPNIIDALMDKLVEEVNELVETHAYCKHICNEEPTSAEEQSNMNDLILSEAADVFEVFTNLLKEWGYTTADLQKAVEKKRADHGAFEDKIYLEWVEEEKKNEY
mgnify:FL=1